MQGTITAVYVLTGQVVATPTLDNKIGNLIGTVSKKE